MEGDHNMVLVEQQQHHVQGAARAAEGNNSRWNPTKEQINILENFYRQGIRTPSAEQIQQITSRLRAYGHIEGKNVFYWFQNHKARQRQKQKQESMAFRNRFFHRMPSHPIFPPPPPSPNQYYPCPNVMCSPYYIPVQNELGLYQQSQYPNIKVPQSGGVKRRPRSTEKPDKLRTTRSVVGSRNTSDGSGSATLNKFMSNFEPETLPLFPLQPTGILQQEREDQNPSSGSIAGNNFAGNSTCSGSEIVGDQPFYDFFSG